MSFPGAEVIFYVMLLGIMVPAEALVVPLYFDLRSLGYTDTLVAIVMPQVAPSSRRSARSGCGPTSGRARTRSSRRRAWTAPDTGARCGACWCRWGLPAITTMVVLVFMWTWNEFLIPLVMATGEELRTAPLGLAFFQGRYTSGTALLAAGATLVALPVVVVYLVLQRHLSRHGGRRSGSRRRFHVAVAASGPYSYLGRHSARIPEPEAAHGQGGESTGP